MLALQPDLGQLGPIWMRDIIRRSGVVRTSSAAVNQHALTCVKVVLVEQSLPCRQPEHPGPGAVPHIW